MDRSEITPRIVQELLSYDRETGRFVWRERAAKWFKSRKEQARWNKRYEGREAFTATNSKGYKQGSILGVMFVAHRVAWAYETGNWPKKPLDHINGKRAENRIANLRLASFAENSKNRKLPSSNKSGEIGVSWCTREQKWRAQIMIGGHQTHLGYFREMGAAVSARRKASAGAGYHPNHGRCA